MFKLSFRHISRLGRGRYFPPPPFCFHLSPPSVYRSSNVCVAECNCSCSMYQFSSSVTRAVSTDVAGRNVLCLIVPKCTHNPEI